MTKLGLHVTTALYLKLIKALDVSVIDLPGVPTARIGAQLTQLHKAKKRREVPEGKQEEETPEPGIGARV